jgi:hypothetical protein
MVLRSIVLAHPHLLSPLFLQPLPPSLALPLAPPCLLDTTAVTVAALGVASQIQHSSVTWLVRSHISTTTVIAATAFTATAALGHTLGKTTPTRS